MARLSFRCPDELVSAVDHARGGVPRERWLRWAVEQALEDDTHIGSSGVTPASPAGAAPRGARRPRVPAGPPPDVFVVAGYQKISRQQAELIERDRKSRSRPANVHQPGPDVSNLRSSSQSKRDVKPITKGKS